MVTSKSNSQIAFFNRASPQHCDGLKIFQSASRAFIGYPLWKDGEEYCPDNLHNCLVDPTCSSEEWEQEINIKKLQKDKNVHMYSKNRNFIPLVTIGSIVVIPRLEQNCAYVGRITSEFEIVNSPPWAEQYIQLRKEQGVSLDSNICRHIGDVAQGWKVNGYKRVDLLEFPQWLNYRFSPTTFGQINDQSSDGKTTAYQFFDQLL